MEKRYLKVKGVPGMLVANPSPGNHRRYAGKLLMSNPPAGLSYAKSFLDVEEVMAWDRHLLDAIEAKKLMLVDSCRACDIQEAQRKMAPKAEPKAAKKSKPEPEPAPKKEEV